MAVIQLPHNGWAPRPYQYKLWDYLQSGGKRAVEVAHRRWGKDDVLLHHTAIAAHERVASYWHCLPLYSQARKAIWTAVNPHTGKRRIDEAFPQELRASTNEAEMFIRFKIGSTWQVIGSDRYNTLVGAGVAGVGFSEYALSNPSSWGYIRPMVEENNGWAVFITTPRGRNHAKSLFDLAKSNPKWFAELSTAHDTGALSPDSLEETLTEYRALYGDDIGRAQFDQEYNCSFNAAILGAFYAREMMAVRNEGRIVPIQPIPGRPVHRAWDIGVRDDTSIWWFQVVGPRIYILDCYTASGVGVDHYAEVIQQRRDLHGFAPGNDYVPHDAKVKEWGTGRTRVETMTSLGLKPIVVPLAGKLDGINAVRLTLPKCLFHPRCEDVGIAAMEQYRREWDDEKKCFKASELHDWCFTADTEILIRYVDNSHLTCYVTRQIKDLPNQGEVLTPCGWKPYYNPRLTRKNARVVAVQFADGLTVRCTPDHMFMTDSGWKSAESLTRDSRIQSTLTRSRSISMAAFIVSGRVIHICRAGGANFIEMCGRALSGLFRAGVTFTTWTKIPLTTYFQTSSACRPTNIGSTLGKGDTNAVIMVPALRNEPAKQQKPGMLRLRDAFGIAATPCGQKDGSNGSARISPATTVKSFLKRYFVRADMPKSTVARFANPLRVECVYALDAPEDVYCITVPGEEAFSLSNGAVVHNCSHLADAFRYLAMSWRTIPVHIDVSLPELKPGKTMLPPPPDYGSEGRSGKRISL